MSAFLFLIGAIIFLIFAIASIANPNTEQQMKESKDFNSKDPEAEFNIGSVLLKLGPLLVAVGGFGYLASEYWIFPESRLITSTLVMLAANLVGLVLFLTKNQKRSHQVMGEGLLIIGSFTFGITMYSLNELVLDRTGSRLFGISEIFGIWFLTGLAMTYFTKSRWLMGISVFVNSVWMALYLSTFFNFGGLLGIEYGVNDLNTYLNLLLPAISVLVLALVYSWHQNNKHNQTPGLDRSFYYLSGLMMFFTLGGMIFKGIDQNFEDGVIGSDSWIFNLSLAVITSALFGIDTYLKKTWSKYSINYLGFIAVAVATALGLMSLIINPDNWFGHNAFVGFYFLEIAFVVWILADFLRNDSRISQILFYGINVIQLFIISTSLTTANWPKLIILLIIMMYAAIINYTRRGLTYYILVAGTIATLLKILATIDELNGFLMLLIFGSVLTAFGLFYTQTRSRYVEAVQVSKKKKETDKNIK